jgi:hypothetical protein
MSESLVRSDARVVIPEAVNAGGEGGSDADGPSSNTKRLGHVVGWPGIL